MKVLHVISSLSIGGAECLVTDMLPGIKQAGIEVSLLVFRRHYNSLEKKLEDVGVPIISLDVENIYHLFILYKIGRVIRNYDIAHVHLFPALYQVALASLFSRVKLVYTEHSTTNRRRDYHCFFLIEKLIYKRYLHVVSVSKETQDSLLAWLKDDGKRYSVIPNGINLDAFKKTMCPKDYPVTILMVSRFMREKDQPTLIRAMQWVHHDAHVIFVGDGDTRRDCENLAKRIGVDKRIHFVGTQSDIPYWISKADIGVLSTHWEGFGLAAIEMMAGGLPVIASDVKGLNHVMKGAGLLFEAGDNKELARIVNVLIEDKDSREEIATRCRNRAEQYDIKHTIADYIQLYQSMY